MDGKKIIEFPEVENKLQAPSKKSVFERQKEIEREKRLQEEAETAAVYEDFVKSFDDDEAPPPTGRFRHDGALGSLGGPTGPPKRHFGGSAIPSGPSVGRGGPGGGRGFSSGPGSLGPPPSSLSRKRTHESSYQGSRSGQRENDRGLLAFDDYDPNTTTLKAFNTSDDEDDSRRGHHSKEPVVAKPTLRLSSLPPGTSPAVIKSLLPSNITIDAVRIIPLSGPNIAAERKSMSAIVTLSKETPANDIDAVVNSLQNRYLGFGYYLSLHRHLSSAAISGAAAAIVTSSSTAMPFGAKPVSLDIGGSAHATPQGQNRGFAPPASYTPVGSGQLGRNGPLLHVPVQAPRDIKELRLIHKTVESMITHGPEFEALLMSRPEVQREEKWAWLWDARSTGGVWYRWRLWEVLTGSQKRQGRGKFFPLFEDSSAWKVPEAPLAFEYATHLDEFVSDSEYNSSDDDESGDEGAGRRPHRQGGAPPPDGSNANDDETSYLNPLEKSKLTHLLARLPTSTGKLRKGDIARVTAFAISHAGRGADEVVAVIISNIENPFSYTTANPGRRKEREQSGDEETPVAVNDDDEKEDTSSASLIGLYIVSDILSSSSTSGVRHSWRYRQLFETSLRHRRVFEGLGLLEKKMNWGRLKAEKWKRSVGSVLSLWEGWCVFPQASQDQFVEVFNNPPFEKEEEKQTKDGMTADKGKSKWKAVEVSAPVVSEPYQRQFQEVESDVDGEPMEDDDVDGDPMEEDEDEDVDGEPMQEEADVEPMEADDDYYEPPPANVARGDGEVTSKEPARHGPSTSPSRPFRTRPRAVDMFADSGSEGD